MAVGLGREQETAPLELRVGGTGRCWDAGKQWSLPAPNGWGVTTLMCQFGDTHILPHTRPRRGSKQWHHSATFFRSRS